jgi:predicted dehydrogenase
MKLGVVGTDARAQRRAAALRTWPGAELVGLLDVDSVWHGTDDVLAAFLGSVEVVFVATPPAVAFQVTAAAAQQGVHVLLEWPPMASLPEAEGVVKLAEEAGIEVGVSRPLRWHPALAPWAGSKAELVLFQQTLAGPDAPGWPRLLADAADLCIALAGSSSVQRVEAEAVRGAMPWPDALACSLRFHSGAYAQIGIRRAATAACTVFAARPGQQHEAHLVPLTPEQTPPEVQETHAFLTAIARQQPVPVSILDGLATLRLVEHLMAKLR